MPVLVIVGTKDYLTPVTHSEEILKYLPDAELVKIDPKSIGVGQYQHDVNQTRLKRRLDETVESCVNRVGVEVNTASASLLSYVAGVGPTLAQNIVRARDARERPRRRQHHPRVRNHRGDSGLAVIAVRHLHPQPAVEERRHPRRVYLARESRARAVHVERAHVEVHELLGAQAAGVGELEQRAAGRSAWAYFNNDIGGDAIEDARTLKRLVGERGGEQFVEAADRLARV